MSSSKTFARALRNIRRSGLAYAYEFLWSNFPTIFYRVCSNVLPFGPRSIQLEVTTRCNLRCRMCTNRNFRGFKMKDMPLKTYKRAIYQAPPQLEFVHLWGVGEPLMNPNFVEMIETAKKAGLEVSFSTNGMLLDADVAEKIVKLGADEIIFSIDSTKPKTFERIRCGAKFEKVMSNVQELIRIKKKFRSNVPRISFAFVVLKENLVEMPEMIGWAHRLGVHKVWFQNVISWDNFTRNQSALAMDGGSVKKIFDKTKKLASQKGVKVRLPKLKVEGKSICKFPWFGPPNITWDGTVTLCPWVPYPFDTYFTLKDGSVVEERAVLEPMVMGNINNSSLMEIWNNQKYQSIRERLKQKQPPDSCSLCLHQYQVIC